MLGLRDIPRAGNGLAIDVAAERDLLERIAVEAENVTRAIAAAEADLRVIDAERAKRRARVVDGAAVADALLAGDAIAEVETEEALLHRRDAIRAGRRELEERARRLGDERAEVMSAIGGRLSNAVAPAVSALRDRASAAVRELLAVLADARAIRGATSSGGAADLDRLLGEPVDALRHRLQIPPAPASQQVRDLLAPAAAAIALRQGQMPA